MRTPRPRLNSYFRQADYLDKMQQENSSWTRMHLVVENHLVIFLKIPPGFLFGTLLEMPPRVSHRIYSIFSKPILLVFIFEFLPVILPDSYWIFFPRLEQFFFKNFPGLQKSFWFLLEFFKGIFPEFLPGLFFGIVPRVPRETFLECLLRFVQRNFYGISSEISTSVSFRI